ncbi:hypothetical protein B0H13DRAFT_1895614 [Mycena leptocephala]|nr:hypothetical protein B0H13DRAFT_1895614 [Mycena leptocephala]
MSTIFETACGGGTANVRGIPANLAHNDGGHGRLSTITSDSEKPRNSLPFIPILRKIWYLGHAVAEGKTEPRECDSIERAAGEFVALRSRINGRQDEDSVLSNPLIFWGRGLAGRESAAEAVAKHNHTPPHVFTLSSPTSRDLSRILSAGGAAGQGVEPRAHIVQTGILGRSRQAESSSSSAVVYSASPGHNTRRKRDRLVRGMNAHRRSSEAISHTREKIRENRYAWCLFTEVAPAGAQGELGFKSAAELDAAEPDARPEPQWRKRVVYGPKRKAPSVAMALVDDPPSPVLQEARRPRTTSAIGPARTSTKIRATRDEVVRTPTRTRPSKLATTRRVSAPYPNRSPPPQAEWMGDNQRALMQDKSSARTRVVRRRKSEPSHARVSEESGGSAARNENTPPVS